MRSIILSGSPLSCFLPALTPCLPAPLPACPPLTGTGLQTWSGQPGVSQKGDTFHIVCHIHTYSCVLTLPLPLPRPLPPSLSLSRPKSPPTQQDIPGVLPTWSGPCAQRTSTHRRNRPPPPPQSHELCKLVFLIWFRSYYMFICLNWISGV